jgi:hypothetical protein
VHAMGGVEREASRNGGYRHTDPRSESALRATEF